MGVSAEVLAAAPPELLDLIGFRPDFGYGGIEARERIARGRYALGELKPRSRSRPTRPRPKAAGYDDVTTIRCNYERLQLQGIVTNLPPE